MDFSFKKLIRSEWRIRTAVRWTGLIALPILIMVIVIGAKFEDFGSETALDHVQLARHLTAGDGLVTSLVRPASLAFHDHLPNHPDLYNAPLHPLLIAACNYLADPSEKTAAGLGLFLWVLSVWLTYAVARDWLGRGAAGLATAFYVCNLAVIRSAVGGLPEPMLVIAVLTTLWLALPDVDARESVPDQPPPSVPWWRAGLAGMACGLAFLSDYGMVALVLVAGLFLFGTAQRKWRKLVVFALGFLLVVLPWLVRNWQLTGSPIRTLYWYEVLANTGSYPGESVWRQLDEPANPLWFMLAHPRQMLRKVAVGLAQYRTGFISVLDPIVTLMFVAALFVQGGNRSWRRALWLTAAGLATGVLVGCLSRVEPGLLSAWAPLLALGAAWVWTDWVRRRVTHTQIHGLNKVLALFGVGEHKREPRFLFNGFLLPARGARATVNAFALVVVAMPLLGYVFVWRAKLPARWAERLEALTRAVPATGTVMTDRPALVAWHAERQAVWLLQDEQDLDRWDKKFGPPAAIFANVAFAAKAADRPDWWTWITLPRGTFRGLTPQPHLVAGGLLRVPQSREATAVSKRELARLEAAVQTNPDSSEARLALASAYLALDWLRDAAEEYRQSSRLDPQNAEALLGIWQVTARLNDNANVLGLAQRVLQTSGQDPAPRAALREVVKVLAQNLALRPNDPWLLLNTALGHARLQDWEAVRMFCDRAEAVAPRAMPARLLLGNLYLQQRMFAEAATELEPLATELPGNAAVQEALGKVRLEQGHWEEALEAFLAAQRIRPERPLPHIEAGYACLRLGKTGEAEKHFQKGLQLSPQSVLGRAGYAEALTAQGKRTAAIEIYEALLEEYPQQLYILNNLAHLLTVEGRDVERAVALARQAAELHPNNPGVQDTLGWAYHHLGRHEEALAQLQEASRSVPNAPLIKYHLGKVLLAVGRRTEGLAAVREALAGGLPDDEKKDAQTLLAGS